MTSTTTTARPTGRPAHPFRLPARVAAAAATFAAVLLAGGTASAHVDPDPIAVQAATSATVGFKVEHGCTGSPTTSMKIQVPSTITDAAPVDKAGWTGTVAANVITFAGGRLDAATEDHFDITFTAPKDAGEAVFNIVQTCEKGEINWVEPTVEGQAEPEHPAAVLKITTQAPTAAELTPATDAPAADGTATTATTATETTKSSSNKAPWIIGALAVVVVAALGTGVVLKRRRSPSSTTP